MEISSLNYYGSEAIVVPCMLNKLSRTQLFPSYSMYAYIYTHMFMNI